MAPILAAEIGTPPQIIDDMRLVELRSALASIEDFVELGKSYSSPEDVAAPLDIDHLLSLIEPWQTWTFEEQVDLQEWIRPLNKIDACLSYYIQKYPSILLIVPVERKTSRGAASPAQQFVSKPAESLEEVEAVPEEVNRNLMVLLRFLSGLMANSCNKGVFNSVEELVDLLAAAADDISAAALEVLCFVSTPPVLHKQQAPEMQQHTSALHSSRTSSHERLVAMARGWGTRGSGLGLYTCCTADDSEFGQGGLPKEAGELRFCFFRQASTLQGKIDDDSSMVEISLYRNDIIDHSFVSTETVKGSEEIDEGSNSKQKRRRVAPATLGQKVIRSTAELFFLCLEKAGGRDSIPVDRVYDLLVEIRLARTFHSRSTRVAALECRLRAIIATLYSHPSQEIMSGYFQAQPELCVELTDLLRATVSSASVSAAASKVTPNGDSDLSSRHDAVSALANPPSVPYELRELALQALTALVGRRDGTTGALQGAARHSVVLNELGVGKGQYLGLLPTLIRFSLSSLSTIMSTEDNSDAALTRHGTSDIDDIAFDIGLAFVQTAMPRPLSRTVQLLKALEFIDSVLTLTSAVVSSQSGTSALTECGIIPALLTTVTVNLEELSKKLGVDGSNDEDALRIKALLRFVTAQAVQIIEGTIVTQTNALKAFHDLNGVEILTRRLANEILAASKSGETSSHQDMDCDGQDPLIENLDVPLRCSQRVLLYSIVTCLTVVFHQESTSSSVTVPSGGAQLRKPELLSALLHILRRMKTFGGHLVALIATLLADVMNSDPHVVRHVHESGLAGIFFGFFAQGNGDEPVLPPVPELIMAVPSVIAALALTEDGANAVKEANPFPALLRIFYHPKYAMPRSRCLLNEMTAIVGTGLDEIMRHTASLKPLVCASISTALSEVAEIGENLAINEREIDDESRRDNGPATDLENQRSCLVQYALNFGQLLEQVLHTEDHCEPFVAAGGLAALLRLYYSLMPTGMQFLCHISCLSCSSVSTLGHSSTEDAVNLAFRCIALRYSSFEFFKTMVTTAKTQLDKLEELQSKMRQYVPIKDDRVSKGLDATYILEGLPAELVHKLVPGTNVSPGLANTLADYLRQVAIVQWMTSILSAAIKTICQRSAELGSGWSRQEREWKKELSSPSFQELFARLNILQQSSIFEASRIRTNDGFEERERQRRESGSRRSLRYRLRIVCPEGAVVRDGIEIDSCASVGNMEMGEIALAFDRCINSSGVLRYRTLRGWVSEQTRGHGREPIAEVISVWEEEDEMAICDATENKNRVEAGVSDIQTASANILARTQTSYSDLFAALSKVVVQGIRGIPLRALSFQPGTIGGHVSTLLRMLKAGIESGFNFDDLTIAIKRSQSITSMNTSGIALYLGCLICHLRAVLYEEKRDRCTVNLPLLIALHNSHGVEDRVSVFDAIHFIFRHALNDFHEKAAGAVEIDVGNKKFMPKIRQSRTTAASFPAAVAFLKRLIVASSITTSPVSSVLSRVKLNDMPLLLGEATEHSSDSSLEESTSFSPEEFFRRLLSTVSTPIHDLWVDPRFLYSPPFAVHPIANLVSEMVMGLEESVKKLSPARSQREESWLSNAFRGLVAGRATDRASNLEQSFEPSEEAVNRLTEMGFTRDQAWVAIDTTRSNQLEIAMEYALSHPPPTEREVERRRSAAEERRRQRDQHVLANEAVAETNFVSRPSGNTSGDQNHAESEMQIEEAGVNNDEHGGVQSIQDVQTWLETWKTSATDVACSVLSGLPSRGVPMDRIDKTADGDGDTEALTVVLTSFLLDISQRYPDQRDKVTSELFVRLDMQLVRNGDDHSDFYTVSAGQEKAFSALCHAAVIIARALPKARVHLLKNNTVGKLVNCIQQIEVHGLEKSNNLCPEWLASALLLLDVMAQPIVAFAANDGANSKEGELHQAEASELQQVQAEHKAQGKELSALARDLVRCLGSKGQGSQGGIDTKSDKKRDEHTQSDCDSEDSPDIFFQSVPPYFPLLPQGVSTACADICLQILGGRFLAPGVVHATFLLILRLLRSPSVSSYCAKAGLAQKIIALPYESRFTGHAGLVTLICRRLLEDEPTLQASMETEIRSVFLKNQEKKRHAGSETKTPTIELKDFMQQLTPLVCREPSTFLKAFAVSVVVEKGKAGDGSDGNVILLSSSERARALKLVSDIGMKGVLPETPGTCPGPRRSSLGRSRKSSPHGKAPVKSNKRGATPKRHKKERWDQKDNPDDESKFPTSSVTNLLVSYAVKMSSNNMESTNGVDEGHFNFGFESQFLWVAEVLGVLSDLVLAIPACATSIHRFRSNKNKANRAQGGINVHHALRGCTSPPRTFVGFLLHYLLVQERSLPEHPIPNSSTDVSGHRQLLFGRAKVAQASARLLFALVARPGEGRRRVVGELTFALSCGQIGLSSSPTPTSKSPPASTVSESQALHSWGELCLGLAAPRNIGTNCDDDKTLSVEVIRIMLDCGMAHALLIALHRVDLQHPRASSIVASLLCPFEVLSRSSVSTAVKHVAEKEAGSIDTNVGGKTAKADEQSKERNDSFADDHMLEDAFARTSRDQQRANEGIEDDFADAEVIEVDRGHEMNDDYIVAEEAQDMDEVEIAENDMDVDEDVEVEVEGESDEEMSSSEGSEESSTGDDDDSSEEDEEEDDDDDDSESMIEEDESFDDQDADSVNDFHVDYNDDSLVENNDFGSDIPPTEGEEQGAGDDWTRLDANGFGGTVLASRRGIGQQLRGMNAPRGFLDAAEAMIGTLLRTGDIQGEALAELEGSLGIRLVRSDRLQGQLNTGQGSPFSNAAAGGRSLIGDRNRDSVGTLPLIQQRNQPDVGYSNLGDGRRWSVSATEYIYGGPSMSAGSRNYDLAPRVIDLADEPVPTASQIDTPLFPGGPAAVAHSRAQHSLHPLLCGLDLPPMNSLVSDLLPHSVRETRRGQLRTRVPGDWTASPVSTSLSGGGFLVSTSSGNIIRTNGGPGGMALSLGTHSRGSSGPIGWSDDGLPLDSTVEEFSAAFDRALGVFVVPQAQREDSIELAMHAPPSILGREASTDIDIADALRPNHRIDGQSEEGPNTESHPDGTDMLEMFGMIGVAVDARDGGGVGSSPAVGSGISNHNETADQAGDSATDSGVTEARRPSPQSTGGSRHEPAIAENVLSPQETEMVVGARYDQRGPGTNSRAGALGGVALTCPPNIDPEAFDALTPEIQREVVEQALATANVASQLDAAASSLDPEALAALPEEMRREVIENEQRLRRLEEQAPADPANAEEMDNASFVASLAPDLREEILLTVDDAFLESLPAHLRTEAHILRGRASTDFRRMHAEPTSAQGGSSAASATTQRALNRTDNREPPESGASRRKERPYGKIKVDVDRDSLVPVPQDRSLSQSSLFGHSDFEVFVRLFYLLSPVRPQRLLHNVLQNMAGVKQLRKALTSVFIRLLHDDNQGAIAAIALMEKESDFTPKMDELSGEKMTDFPPAFLIGASPTVADSDELNPNLSMIRRKQTSDTAASIAANLPISARGSRHEHQLPPVVASRIMETLQAMCKNSPRFCISILVVGPGSGDVQGTGAATGFDMLLDLLEKTRYAKSSANLEQLLTLLESTVSPLSNLPKHGEDDADLNQRDLDAASSTGKEWVEVPRVAVSQRRLQLLCSILRMETCRESSFVKVNTIVRRLCRVDANRGYILAELASVARALGADAIRDLKALNIRMLNAVESGIGNSSDLKNVNSDSTNEITEVAPKSKGGTSSSVAVSTSTSELKLLRVLQTLQALCIDVVDESGANKDGNVYVTEEFVHLLNAMELDDLWAELSSCLKVVQVLEGVVIEHKDASGDGSNEGEDENGDSAKKLQNSVAGLLTRFLPSIEAFFVANATSTRGNEKTDRQEGGDGVDDTYHLVGGPRLFDFVTSNKVLVNAMIRSNSNLLDKGLKALVHVPRCRVLLDFDVKRQWFKSQLRRLRQQANRRNASLRLHINRENVLIDAYHQLCLRNADEMRGRLHITFRDEQGVDAGGLSREFFGILAKEIFNPNYALFTSTEDGSTFQPNPNSSINPDHLSYFRFVGRIVGKAVLDGYLLDAHFTRSLYKHMLGIEPTHHDMEAIDPDYYKNLKTILEYDLGDLGLELTFSIEDHSFGRSRMIDLVPNGRNVPVTEESKANYVRLVCQHRMTTSIKSQINAYLDGFYELVSRDLISIFTPRELELLISGLPDIDVLDLKQNTDYVGWKATDKQIQWFWNVLFSLSRNQKASFLQFVTGSSKVPLAGFGELPGMRGVQKFSIHKAGGSAGALMSAHTCFNSLDLPIYSNEEELKEKLLYAITEGSGGFALA